MGNVTCLVCGLEVFQGIDDGSVFLIGNCDCKGIPTIPEVSTFDGELLYCADCGYEGCGPCGCDSTKEVFSVEDSFLEFLSQQESDSEDLFFLEPLEFVEEDQWELEPQKPSEGTEDIWLFWLSVSLAFLLGCLVGLTITMFIILNLNLNLN